MVTREDIARIIEPTYWRYYEDALRPFAQNRGTYGSEDHTTYRYMWEDGCRTLEDAKKWFETTDRPVMVRVEKWRESLAKADDILWLMERDYE